MSIRVYDLILANPGGELSDTNTTINRGIYSIYNPNNLGGGYVRDDAGNLGLASEQISFDLIFKTDAESTAYQKYLETVSDISEKKMVWLRYGVPLPNGYTYAYRPGYVAGITKTEGKYEAASLLESVTVQTLGGWFKLYEFSPEQAAVTLNPNNARRTPSVKIFSNYPDDFKSAPFAYPYWYMSIIEEITRRANGTNTKNGTWYSKWGNVLDPKSDVYQLFAVHAPAISVSDFEASALGTLTPTIEQQMNQQKGVSFASNQEKVEDPTLEAEIKASTKNAQNAISAFRKKAKNNQSFKASLHNYSERDISADGPFDGSYTSYLIQGYAQKGGTVSIASASTGVEVCQLKFLISGHFVIDTAEWANIYKVNGSSSAIDFSKFVKTSAKTTEKITTNGVEIYSVLMRRGVFGV